MKYLDYIYYRCAQFFIKHDGLPGQRAIMTVAMIVVVLCLDIWAVVYLNFLFGKIERYDNGIFIVIAGALSILLFFYFRYRKRYPQLKRRWGNETKKQRRIRGMGVVLAIALPFIIFFCLFLFLGEIGKPH